MDPTVQTDAIRHRAGVGIKQDRAFPIENVGGFGQIAVIPAYLVNQTRGNTTWPVDTGIFRLVGGCPIQASAKIGVPGPGEYHIEIPSGDVPEPRIAGNQISARESDAG